MRARVLAALVFASCASPTNSGVGPWHDNRDLGDHLQAPGSDGAVTGSPDLGVANAHADLAGADFTVLPDLTTPVANGDMAMPTVDYTIYAHEAHTLYTVDPSTFALTTVGSFGVADEITDLAVSSSGNLVAISRTGLYTVDASTGAATLIADGLFTEEVALTYLADGRLIGADKTGNLSQISYSLGAITFTSVVGIGAYGGSWQTAGDLVDIADNTMYGLVETTTAGSPSTLAIVNNVNGQATTIGSNTGSSNLWGAAWSRGYMLAFSSTGDVVRINPASGVGTVVKSYPGKSFFGAATSPDAQ
jgi:hypothetical protein